MHFPVHLKSDYHKLLDTYLHKGGIVIFEGFSKSHLAQGSENPKIGGQRISIGAWSASKGETPVIAIAGDGGFGQYMAELTTLVKYIIPVKMIVLNNNQLAKISKEQRTGQLI